MTIANWCIVAACVLPVITIGIAKASTRKLSRKNGGYDNQHPREWAARLSGWQARALSAQNNGFEALPLFIAAVILAQQAHADQSNINALALCFIAIRIAYVILYLIDYATLRSLVWGAGVAVCIAIMSMA
jgi:uncharacterized MAPEG superfamily protein